jgi:hypothetical protein
LVFVSINAKNEACSGMTLNLRMIRIDLTQEMLHALFIFYAAFFFPFIATINYFLNAESNFVSIVYRSTALILSVIVISSSLVIKQFKFPSYFWAILLFWAFYLGHYFIDLFVYEHYLFPENGQFFYFSQGFLITFLNFVAIYFASYRVTDLVLRNVFLWGFICINVLLFVLIMTRLGADPQALLQMRFELESEESGNKYLNPITISSNAVFALLLIWSSHLPRVLKLVFLAVALVNLFFSASMSPALALILLIGFFAIKNFILNIQRAFIALGILIFIVWIALQFVDINELLIIQRVLEGGSGESSIERVRSVASAFDQIKENIFWGTHYFTLSDHSSPHNLFIDILLSTGIFGLLLFLVPFFNYLVYVFRNLSTSVFCQLGFVTLVIVQFSGYVFGANDFFSLMAVLFCFSAKEAV